MDKLLARIVARVDAEEVARRMVESFTEEIDSYARLPDRAVEGQIVEVARLGRRGAAERLHVHPNTLDYRLRRVEELTELRMDRPHDIALITLGLKHRALRREASVSGEATADL